MSETSAQSAFDTAMAAAATAFEAGDYATARTKVRAAAFHHARLATEVQQGPQRIRQVEQMASRVKQLLDLIDEAAAEAGTQTGSRFVRGRCRI